MFVEVEIFRAFVDINLMDEFGGPVIASFEQGEHGNAFRKKARKFAKRFAKKNGGLEVKQLDHTKGE